MQPGAGPPDMAAHQRQRDQASRVVGAVDVLAYPHAPEDHPRLGPRKGPRHVAQHLGRNAADLGHLLGRKILQMRDLGGEVLGIGLDILPVVQLLLHDHMHDRIQHRHIRPGPELQHVRGKAAQADPARIHHDQLAAALGELLEIGRGNRVVLDRIGADDDGDIRVLDLVEGRGHSGRADVLHQRRDRRRMAQPRAVIDVVVPEPLPDELLEQVGFLVGAFGAAKARHLAPPPLQATGGKVHRLFPAGFPEMALPVAGIDVQPLGRRILAADQRHRQAVRVVDVVEAKAPLDAQPPLVRRPVDPLDIFHPPVLDLQRHLAAHATEGADAGDFAVVIRAVALLGVVQHRRRHQRARGAGLHAFAAGHAGRGAHRVVHVEDRIGRMPPPRHADHVVHLHLAAGAHTQIALDAGIEIDPHGDMAVVQQRDMILFHRRKPAVGDAVQIGHVPQMRRAVMRLLPLRLVRHQQLGHHRPRLHRAFRGGPDHHPLRGLADARGRQGALALDLDHAGAAVAVRAIARRRLVAEMRDHQPAAVGDLPDRQALRRVDLGPVKRETDGLGHGCLLAFRDL